MFTGYAINVLFTFQKFIKFIASEYGFHHKTCKTKLIFLVEKETKLKLLQVDGVIKVHNIKEHKQNIETICIKSRVSKHNLIVLKKIITALITLMRKLISFAFT